ncbi:hypothetical protein [Microbacterium hydrocarbonoxydans]|uniref:hypothetical protein n=1 Tax=Microbacterium hydrocarbonoxydans TaxID=273678 RepID=UPI003D958280
MTWSKFSDTYPRRADVMLLTDAAFRLHFDATCWANEQLTDGRIPTAIALRLRPLVNPEECVDELVRAGLWEEVDGGYQLDWSEQETADTVRERRAASAERTRKSRDRATRHAAGDHSLCDRCSAVMRNGARNTSRNALHAPSVTPPRPSPDPTVGGEGEEAADAAFAGAPATATAEQKAHLRDLVIITERRVPPDGYFDQMTDEQLKQDIEELLEEVTNEHRIDSADPLVVLPSESRPELWAEVTPWGREVWVG